MVHLHTAPAHGQVAFIEILPPSYRYKASSKFNLPAILISGAVTLSWVAALSCLGIGPALVRDERLTVVDLGAPPPPPPPKPRPSLPKRSSPKPAMHSAPLPLVELRRTEPSAIPEPGLITEAEAETEAATGSAPSLTPAPPAPPALSGPLHAKDLATRMIEARPPHYPWDSRRNREQGTVVLELSLAPDGRVSTITVAHSSGFLRLDEAAMRAVWHWRWAPTWRNGQPVEVRGEVEIPFILED